MCIKGCVFQTYESGAYIKTNSESGTENLLRVGEKPYLPNVFSVKRRSQSKFTTLLNINKSPLVLLFLKCIPMAPGSNKSLYLSRVLSILLTL